MKSFKPEEIEQKMNCPGFYEGVVSVNKIFNIKSASDLRLHWRFVKVYLNCYETSSLTLTDEGVQAERIRPFKSEEDIELAKYIMMALYQ
jgi:hypothetical protein